MNTSELKDKFRRLPKIDRGWKAHRYSLRCAVEHENPTRFMRWPVVVTTMAIAHNAPYIGAEAEYLLQSPDWERKLEYCKHLPIGGDIPFGIYDPTLIHQCYHLAMFEQTTGIDPTTVNGIVEVGAGYGALAVLLYGLGYRGRYQIFDFPECCLLQEFYISSVLGELPVEWQTEPKPAELLIASYSLSEMRPEERLPILAHPYQAYLLAFQGWWAEDDWECDNLQWFQENLMQKRNDVYWTIMGNPNQEGHYYLFGVQK